VPPLPTDRSRHWPSATDWRPTWDATLVEPPAPAPLPCRRIMHVRVGNGNRKRRGSQVPRTPGARPILRGDCAWDGPSTGPRPPGWDGARLLSKTRRDGSFDLRRMTQVGVRLGVSQPRLSAGRSSGGGTFRPSGDVTLPDDPRLRDGDLVGPDAPSPAGDRSYYSASGWGSPAAGLRLRSETHHEDACTPSCQARSVVRGRAGRCHRLSVRRPAFAGRGRRRMSVR
jgi:hypothetical protein